MGMSTSTSFLGEWILSIEDLLNCIFSLFGDKPEGGGRVEEGLGGGLGGWLEVGGGSLEDKGGGLGLAGDLLSVGAFGGGDFPAGVGFLVDIEILEVMRFKKIIKFGGLH